MPRYIDADTLYQKIDAWREKIAMETPWDEDVACLGDVLDIIDDAPTEDVVEVVRNAPTTWHKVNSRKDLPELGEPVIVEHYRGVTVAILDDAWVENQPMWYENNEPIGMWDSVKRWMEIPR